MAPRPRGERIFPREKFINHYRSREDVGAAIRRGTYVLLGGSVAHHIRTRNGIIELSHAVVCEFKSSRRTQQYVGGLYVSMHHALLVSVFQCRQQLHAEAYRI